MSCSNGDLRKIRWWLSYLGGERIRKNRNAFHVARWRNKKRGKLPRKFTKWEEGEKCINHPSSGFYQYGKNRTCKECRKEMNLRYRAKKRSKS